MPINLKKVLKIIGLAVLIIVLASVFIAFFSNQSSRNFTSDDAVINGRQNNLGASFSVRDMVSSKAEEMSSGYAQAPNTAGQIAPSQAATKADKKIIKTGNLNLKVEKTDAAAVEIANIVQGQNGEVSNINFNQSSRGTKSGYMTVRVPYDKFADSFSAIKKVATQVVSESTNAQDITEEYIDLEARLKSKRAEEQSFLELLNRWGKVDEILSVTRELARVRSEIEQLEGRQRYLNSQTDMSTITVNLTEDIEISPVSQDWRPVQVFKASVKQLIANSQNFTDGLIRFVITVLPMLFIYLLIIWLFYFIGKRIYKRFKTPKQP